MPTTQPLFQHHKHCDDLFADAEEACGKGDWAAGAKAFVTFAGQLETHFLSEEEVLFPAFESATGMVSGPTEVMRGEHRQMRGLLAQMKQALDERDGEGFGGTAETLLIMMQQHNMKEENILYPMCDNALGGSEVGATIAQRLAAA
jgi:iron-sulfur cluster repair protein YtfE (RIC family)